MVTMTSDKGAPATASSVDIFFVCRALRNQRSRPRPSRGMPGHEHARYIRGHHRSLPPQPVTHHVVLCDCSSARIARALGSTCGGLWMRLHTHRWRSASGGSRRQSAVTLIVYHMLDFFVRSPGSKGYRLIAGGGGFLGSRIFRRTVRSTDADERGRRKAAAADLMRHWISRRRGSVGCTPCGLHPSRRRRGDELGYHAAVMRPWLPFPPSDRRRCRRRR